MRGPCCESGAALNPEVPSVSGLSVQVNAIDLGELFRRVPYAFTEALEMTGIRAFGSLSIRSCTGRTTSGAG